MSVEFITKNYPANDVTDGQFLYRSLGSFWTYIFSDKNLLKGYTTGMAEELIQAYYTLTEVINQYSVKDVPILHKEKWYPLKIKKSEFNKTKFIFEPGGAVFGPQSNEDEFYPNALFRFGYPKETSGTVYSFQPSDELKKFGAISNKIIAPSLLLLPGVDVIVNGSTLFFNLDLFNHPNIPKVKLVEDLGEYKTYTDSEGNTVIDEYIVLWVYNAEIDNKQLYQNFGVLFDINMPSNEAYKSLLKTMMNMAVEGPTMAALKAAFASLAGIPFIIESEETIEDIYSDEKTTYIITDSHVYKVEIDRPLSRNARIAAKLYAGDILTDDVKLLDTVTSGDWWSREIESSKLGFSSHIFLADIKKQLFFENGAALITYRRGKLNFPVMGDSKDIQAFNDYINIPVNRVNIIDSLGLYDQLPITIEDETILDIRKGPGFEQYIITDHNAYLIPKDRILIPSVALQTKIAKGTTIVELHPEELVEDLYPLGEARVLNINPVDFVFKTLIKNNTALLKLKFYSEPQLNLFFKLLPLLRTYLPPHVYVLVYMNYNLPTEVWENFNLGLTILDFPGQKFSLDGSTKTGERPGSLEDGKYYKDYKNRLFCVSVSPQKDGLPLHDNANIDTLNVDNSNNPSSSPGIKCGMLRTEIPSQVTPPGQTTARRPSTREIQSILLIDF